MISTSAIKEHARETHYPVDWDNIAILDGHVDLQCYTHQKFKQSP